MTAASDESGSGALSGLRVEVAALRGEVNTENAKVKERLRWVLAAAVSSGPLTAVAERLLGV